MTNVLLPGTLVPALREARRIKESEFSRIWKYLYEPKREVKLTDHEEEVRRRLANMWQLLTGKILNDRKAVQAHTTWCKDNCMQISERTAYDDVRRAKALYGDPKLFTPAFEKARISAVLLEQLELLKSEQEKGTAAEKIEVSKAINQIVSRYNAVNGLEGESSLPPHRPAITIVFNSDPETLKKQAAELMEGVEDVDFEDV